MTEAAPGAVSAREEVLVAAFLAFGWGLKMSTGLLWRTVLFFGLTAGYVIIAALPYLA